MTIMITHIFLQNYWWFIVSLLGSFSYSSCLFREARLFYFPLQKNEMQRTMIVNTLGRKWEFTFTTLVTFGGPSLPLSHFFIQQVSEVHTGFGWLFCSALSSRQLLTNTDQSLRMFMVKKLLIFFCFSTDLWDHF